MSRKAVIPGRKALPRAFIYTEAQAAGISAERLYADRAQGLVDQIARGLYRWADAPEIDQVLLEFAQSVPRGTLCLGGANARRVETLDNRKFSGLHIGMKETPTHRNRRRSARSASPAGPKLKIFRPTSWRGPSTGYISHLLRELGRLDLEISDIESHDRPPHTRTVLSDLLAYREAANEALANLIDWQRLDLAQMKSRLEKDRHAKPRIEVSAKISQMNNLSVRWYPAGYHRSYIAFDVSGSEWTNVVARRKWDCRPDFMYFTGDEEASFQGRATNELMYVRGVGSLRPDPYEYGSHVTYNRDVVDGILICAVRSAYETLIQQLELSFEVDVLDAFDFVIREESDPEDPFTERFPNRRVVDWSLQGAAELERAREAEAELQRRAAEEAELASVEEKFGCSLEKLIRALERASTSPGVESATGSEEANRRAAKDLRAAGFKIDAGQVRRIRQLIESHRIDLLPERLRPRGMPISDNVVPFSKK